MYVSISLPNFLSIPSTHLTLIFANSNGFPSHLPNPSGPTVHEKTEQLLYQYLQRPILHHPPTVFPSFHPHGNYLPATALNMGNSCITQESVILRLIPLSLTKSHVG